MSRPGFGAGDVALRVRRTDRPLAGELESITAGPLRHWLPLTNALVAATVLGALASPVVREAGLADLADAVETTYRAICLQRPDHSFFLLGHQVPLEQRMLAMAAGQLVGGLLYGLARWRLRPLPLLVLLLCTLPIAADVFSQTIGLRESTWAMRSLTGALFSLALVFWAYPFIDRALVRVNADG